MDLKTHIFAKQDRALVL